MQFSVALPESMSRIPARSLKHESVDGISQGSLSHMYLTHYPFDLSNIATRIKGFSKIFCEIIFYYHSLILFLITF